MTMWWSAVLFAPQELLTGQLSEMVEQKLKWTERMIHSTYALVDYFCYWGNNCR